MPTFLTKSDETILKSIKIDQEILMRKKIVVCLHLLLIIRNPNPEMIPKTKNIKDQKLTCASRSPTLEKTARISAKMMAKATWGDGVEDDEEKNRWRRRTKRRKERK